MNDYIIREIKKDEYKLLDDFLYEAIFVPKGVEKPSKDIINNEELQVYVKDFGKYKDDNCLVVEIDNKVIGAVWCRIMNDYGHVSNDAPSLAMSLCEEYRGRGIGTMLLLNMLVFLRDNGYKKVSLSVQKSNSAFEIYKKVGFKVFKENDEDYIMVCNLK